MKIALRTAAMAAILVLLLGMPVLAHHRDGHTQPQENRGTSQCHNASETGNAQREANRSETAQARSNCPDRPD